MKNDKAQPEVAASILDLSSVDTKRDNVHNPCLVLSYNSFTGKTSALAVPIVHEVTKESNVGNTKASGAKVVKDETLDKGTVALLLTNVRDLNTLDLNWVEGGTRVTINLRKLLKIRPFEMPKGTVAYIPVAKGSVDKFGTCLFLKFGEATFREIEVGKRKNAKKAKAAKEAVKENKEAQAGKPEGAQ